VEKLAEKAGETIDYHAEGLVIDKKALEIYLAQGEGYHIHAPVGGPAEVYLVAIDGGGEVEAKED